MSRNPYERQERGAMAAMVGDLHLHGGPMGGSLGFSERPPRFLALEDLEAMAGSVTRRTQAETQGRLRRLHRDELREAQRHAWDEGQRAGEEDGRLGMLRAIDEQFGPTVRGLVERLSLALHSPDADQVALLHETRRCLQLLVEAHHDGFSGDVVDGDVDGP